MSLQSLDFPYCKSVTIIKLSIVKVIPMYAKVLHSELVSLELVSMFLILCKIKLVINVLVCLCLQNRYTIRVIDITEVTEDTNTKISTI